MNKLKLSISSDINSIPLVEKFIDDFVAFFALPDALFGRVSLAVVEAVNNAILFGNDRKIEKQVLITVENRDSRLFISILDQGTGFDYAVIPDPTLPTNLDKEKGRGLYLMKTLSDELIFSKDGSEVTLVFDL